MLALGGRERSSDSAMMGSVVSRISGVMLLAVRESLVAIKAIRLVLVGDSIEISS